MRGGREPLLELPRDGDPRAVTPGDHVRLLTELLQPTGPELARRWLAILAMVPREEREEVVRAISQRVVETYGKSVRRGESFGLRVVSPPVQRDGYIEHRETVYVERPDVNVVNEVQAKTASGKRA